MRALISAAIAIVVTAGSVQAHFVFLVPSPDGKSAKAIHSDSLEPDSRVDINKIGASKLFVRRAGVADAPINWTKEQHAYAFAVPGEGPRLVFGTTDYGVMQRGEDKPFLLRYHSKAVIGDYSAMQSWASKAEVEIVPTRFEDGMRFQTIVAGKPLANAEITVIAPVESEGGKMTTGAPGVTKPFRSPGRYAAVLLHTEKKPGESGGKKYEEIRSYATVVVTIPK